MWNLSSFLLEGFISGSIWRWWLEGKVCVSFSEAANFPYVLPPPEHEGPGGSVSPWLRVPVGLVLLSLAGSPSSSNSGWLHFCWGFNWISPVTNDTEPLFFFIFSIIFISWRLITLQYCSGFCHTLTWISHGFTCFPHPDPPSCLPLHPIPLGLPSAPALSTCLMH